MTKQEKLSLIRQKAQEKWISITQEECEEKYRNKEDKKIKPWNNPFVNYRRVLKKH